MNAAAHVCNTLPHEFAINAQQHAHQNDARIWADSPHTPSEDDRNVAALYSIAWALWSAGDIDDDCRDDLLEIALS